MPPAIVSAIVQFVIVTAISYLLAPKPKAPPSRGSPEDEIRGVTVSKDSNNNSIPIVYGKRQVGLTRVFVESSGTDNQYLYVAGILCEGGGGGGAGGGGEGCGGMGIGGTGGGGMGGGIGRGMSGGMLMRLQASLQAANSVGRTEFVEGCGARRCLATVENRRVKWMAVVLTRRIIIERESRLKSKASSWVQHLERTGRTRARNQIFDSPRDPHALHANGDIERGYKYPIRILRMSVVESSKQASKGTCVVSTN
jgi:hypothetical protein